MNKYENVFLISDSDLDGYGCVLMGKKLIGERTDSNFEYATPKRENLNTVLRDIILSRKYTTIFMTDCYPLEQNISIINQFVNEGNEFVLLDHHKTALKLNQYSWSRVKVETNGHKHCGTELFYEYLKEDGFNVSDFNEIVELIRSYDTWDWYYAQLQEAYKLNQLFFFFGGDEFIENISWKISQELPILTEVDYNVLNAIDKLDAQYINEHKDTFETFEYEGLKVGVVFADRCISVLGQTICQENPQLDYCCLVDLSKNKCSLRSIGKTDVSVIAKKFGGGGHAQAGGFPLNDKVKRMVIEVYFKEIVCN